MIKVLFWNIKDVYNNHRIDFLNSIAASCDIIILAEAYNSIINNKINGFSLIQTNVVLNRQWIKFFKKNSNSNFTLERVEDIHRHRITVAKLSIQGKLDIQLYGLHLKKVK